MGRFEVEFKKYIKPKDYKYNPNKSYVENEHNLKRMAFLEYSCREIYTRLASVHGEEYAAKLLGYILDGTFQVTNLEKFPFPEYKYVNCKKIMAPYLSVGLAKGSFKESTTLINFSTEIFREILNETKNGRAVEFYDLLICLSILVEKWTSEEYPSSAAVRTRDRNRLLYQVLIHIFKSLYTKAGDTQTITISIVDKFLFNYITGGINSDYRICLDHTGRMLKASYESYTETVRMFLEAINMTSNDNNIMPNVRVYATVTNKLLPEILEHIEMRTGIGISTLYDIFKDVNFDAQPQLMSGKEYRDALRRMEMRRAPKEYDTGALRKELREIFRTDYINYLNIVDRKLAYNLQSLAVTDKVLESLEMFYYKKVYDIFPSILKNNISEVTIDITKFQEQFTSTEAFEDILSKLYLDAQALNQMRVLILGNRIYQSESPTMRVSVTGLNPDQYSLAHTVMQKQDDFLKSSYNMVFNHSITQRVFFRDKRRKCYLYIS